MKNRHSKKCFLPSDVSGLDLTISVSQNVTSFHTEYSHFWWMWKAFLEICKIEMLLAFFLILANSGFFISAPNIFANMLNCSRPVNYGNNSRMR